MITLMMRNLLMVLLPDIYGMYCVKMERLLEVQGLVLKTVKPMMMGK